MEISALLAGGEISNSSDLWCFETGLFTIWQNNGCVKLIIEELNGKQEENENH